MNTQTYMCEDMGKKSFSLQAKQNNNDVRQGTDRDSHIKIEISLR